MDYIIKYDRLNVPEEKIVMFIIFNAKTLYDYQNVEYSKVVTEPGDKGSDGRRIGDVEAVEMNVLKAGTAEGIGGEASIFGVSGG